MERDEKPRSHQGLGGRGGLVRVVGYFFPEEVQALDREAQEKRISRAEVLRRALRAYLNLRL